MWKRRDQALFELFHLVANPDVLQFHLPDPFGHILVAWRPPCPYWTEALCHDQALHPGEGTPNDGGTHRRPRGKGPATPLFSPRSEYALRLAGKRTPRRLAAPSPSLTSSCVISSPRTAFRFRLHEPVASNIGPHTRYSLPPADA